MENTTRNKFLLGVVIFIISAASFLAFETVEYVIDGQNIFSGAKHVVEKMSELSTTSQIVEELMEFFGILVIVSMLSLTVLSRKKSELDGMDSEMLEHDERMLPRLIIVSFILSVGIFALDVLIPRGVAVGGLYMTLVLISMWSHNRNLPIMLALAGTTLIWVGYGLSVNQGTITWMATANRYISMLMVWITCLLVCKRRRLSEKLRESDKLKAALQLSGAVCHDMAQPLQALYGALALAELYATSDKSRDNLELVKFSLNRLKESLGRLSRIRKFKTVKYVDGVKIIDLDASTNDSGAIIIG